jgi:hypothetical protein
MYIIFPPVLVVGAFEASLPFDVNPGGCSSLDDTDGSSLFVNIVALELITPNTKAMHT